MSIRPVLRPQGALIDEAVRLDREGQIDAALDVVFDHIDSLLVAGKFGEVDGLISSLDPSVLSANLLVGFLTITLAARDVLPSRATFFQEVRRRLAERGELVSGLLTGLE